MTHPPSDDDGKVSNENTFQNTHQPVLFGNPPSEFQRLLYRSKGKSHNKKAMRLVEGEKPEETRRESSRDGPPERDPTGSTGMGSTPEKTKKIDYRRKRKNGPQNLNTNSDMVGTALRIPPLFEKKEKKSKGEIKVCMEKRRNNGMTFEERIGKIVETKTQMWTRFATRYAETKNEESEEKKLKIRKKNIIKLAKKRTIQKMRKEQNRERKEDAMRKNNKNYEDKKGISEDQKNIIKEIRSQTTIKIASMNADNASCRESRMQIIDKLERYGIDLACVQETHDMSNKNMNMGNYDIFRSSSDSKIKAYKQAGVAIYVHKAYRDSVNNIIRHDDRNIQLTLDGDDFLKPIIILNSYAPHRGYNEETREKYWKKINEIHQKNRKSKDAAKIWMTDNNGEIGRGKKDEEIKTTKKAEEERIERLEIIGKETRRKNIEKGNGMELFNVAKKNRMVEMTTRVKCGDCKNCKRKNRKDCENLSTWTHPNGKIKRQIDYVLIEKNYKNWIKKIDKTKNASNTSIYQHKMIICDIRQKLKKTDKASARRKEHINFDIKKMREDKKKKIDLAEDEKAGKILEKYENETGRQRRQRIWKTTARIINSHLRANYPKELKKGDDILQDNEKDELKKLYLKEENLKNEIYAITKKQEKTMNKERLEKAMLAFKIYTQAKKQTIIQEETSRKWIDITRKKPKTTREKVKMEKTKGSRLFDIKDKNGKTVGKKLKYDIGKMDFQWNIKKENVAEKIKEKYIYLEEQYIEINIKKDIENEIEKIRKFNIVYRSVKSGMENIKKKIEKIRKEAKDRENLKKIKEFNENARKNDPKDTKKIWNFLNAMKRNAKGENETKFTPLEKKNGELTKTLSENIERWEEWVEEMFFKEDTTPKGFFYEEAIWEEKTEEIKKRIEEFSIYDKKPERKMKQDRKKSCLHTFLNENPEIKTTLNKKIEENEIRKAIRSLKNNKSFGDDRIPSEVFKENEDKMVEIMKEMVEGLEEDNEMTGQWTHGIITLLHKKKSKTDTNNYRPICLLNIAYKLVTIIITRRLNPIMNFLTKETQTAYKNNRSTYDIISIIDKFTRTHEQNGNDKYKSVTLLDLSKAFDRLNRKKMMTILAKKGIPEYILKLIYIAHKNTTLAPKQKNQIGKTIKNNNGCFQGSPLSALIFIIYADEMMEDYEKETRKTKKEKKIEKKEEKIRIRTKEDEKNWTHYKMAELERKCNEKTKQKTYKNTNTKTEKKDIDHLEYADDTTLLNLCKEDEQIKAEAYKRCAENHEMLLQLTKTYIIRKGIKKTGEECDNAGLKEPLQEIKETKEDKILGLTLGFDKNRENMMKKRISAGLEAKKILKNFLQEKNTIKKQDIGLLKPS